MRISEVAQRAGIKTSTLRYYERIGLVEPVGRATNGYRLYDDTTLAHLAFIGRAKRLGMTLKEAATLAEPWFAGECAPLQGRLRVFVTSRIAEVRRRIAEDRAFECQLERILGQLEQVRAAAERCQPDCGCDVDPLESSRVAAPVAPPVAAPVAAPINCSLGADGIDERLDEWRRVVAQARSVERGDTSLSAVFDPSAAVISEVARLCAAEMECCPFLTFSLEMTVESMALKITVDLGATGSNGVGFFDRLGPT